MNTKAIVVLLIVIVTIALALVLVPLPKGTESVSVPDSSFRGPVGEPFVKGPTTPPPGY